MPIHEYINEATGKKVDIYVPANAPLVEHQRQTVNGVVYKRVYTAPLASVDSGVRLGDATQQDFNRITTGKKGLKIKDTWEVSAEMAAKRRQRDGIDLVREEVYRKHKEETGEEHEEVVRKRKIEAANARLKDMGIKINFP